MYVHFNCRECNARFQVSEDYFIIEKSISCPSCKKKVPAKLFKQINEFAISRESESFDISFYPSLNIRLDELRYRMKKTYKAISLDESGNPTDKTFTDSLHEEDSFDVMSILISSAVASYHNQLRKNLLYSGIDIGEVSF